MRHVRNLGELKLDSGFHYCATPYSRYYAGIDRAYSDAVDLSEALDDYGIPHFMPIIYTHEIIGQTGLNPYDHDFWLTFDRPFMEKARDLVVVAMDGWEESIGIIAERAYFGAASKPIFLIDPFLISPREKVLEA